MLGRVSRKVFDQYEAACFCGVCSGVRLARIIKARTINRGSESADDRGHFVQAKYGMWPHISAVKHLPTTLLFSLLNFSKESHSNRSSYVMLSLMPMPHPLSKSHRPRAGLNMMVHFGHRSGRSNSSRLPLMTGILGVGSSCLSVLRTFSVHRITILDIVFHAARCVTLSRLWVVCERVSFVQLRAKARKSMVRCKLSPAEKCSCSILRATCRSLPRKNQRLCRPVLKLKLGSDFWKACDK